MQRRHIPASSVVVLLEGSLGSPVPRAFVAMTRNSYSVQGSKSTTVTISAFPSTLRGAEKHTCITTTSHFTLYTLIKNDALYHHSDNDKSSQVTASLHSSRVLVSLYWMVYLDMGLRLSVPWLQRSFTYFTPTSSTRTPPGAPGGPEGEEPETAQHQSKNCFSLCKVLCYVFIRVKKGNKSSKKRTTTCLDY